MGALSQSVLETSTMAEDTLVLISQLQDGTSEWKKKDAWDFGCDPERKGNVFLLFEKEVLDIQAKEETISVENCDGDGCRVVTWPPACASQGFFPGCFCS